MSIISHTAVVSAWGRAKNARRVTHLTPTEREVIRSGGTVLIHGCPAVKGITTRRVIEANGAFYARMPR